MEASWHALCDELGPSKVVLLHEPRSGLEAIVVVDDVAAGPAIGGTRMAPDVTIEEVARLARAMTLKNAAAGLPHGGAKAGIVADPATGARPGRPAPSGGKEQVVRAFARAIADLHDYIPGPDMGTDETAMAWVFDEIHRCVGLPRVLGGIPLDELGATGFGLAACADELQAAGRLHLDGARVVIQGFGAVGKPVARHLVDRGALIVAVADSRGAVHQPVGLDVAALLRHHAEAGTVVGFPGADPIDPAELVGLDVDLWVPAARPDVFTEANVDQVKASVVLPGANIPATPAAEQLLHERGILMVPDFIANAGGVICASVEYHGGTPAQAFAVIEERIRRNTGELLARMAATGEPPRTVATAMARARIDQAHSFRRT